MREFQQTALAKYLATKSPEYYGKACELREAVEGWLGYIVPMFPHYTQHSIRHSDEIIVQLSKILFRNEDSARSITVPLSATEAYILISSAYLHDIGMVVSPKDQQDIINSPDWKQWLARDQKAAKNYAMIEEIREGSHPESPAIPHLLADMQMRYMIAEHVRRSHHIRAVTIMTQHENLLGRFAFGDHQLLNVISDVCMGHGMDRRQLNDGWRFPTRVDIRQEKVCVRFLAILLRIGDLLDMSVERALPLLFRAASPLPSDSVAHWTQYQRIMTRNTSFDKIELRAQCQTQEEHRLLQDWCEWLVEEIRNAGTVMGASDRHKQWRPPVATIGLPGATIAIEKAPGATYKPVKWKLVLDHEAVLERLIKDVYSDQHAFLRELIQNAADANRCQMYHDLADRGLKVSNCPSQVDPEILDNYPIRVSLEARDEKHAITNEIRSQQVLVVEDYGIGMDTAVIQNYFLQIGRSFYKSEEFERQFSFTPTSQFGVGFLSVFSVTEKVTVETLKSTSTEGPLQLTLNGPRSYMLVDEGHRSSPGTRIEIWLNEDMPQGILTSLVKSWCLRLEFPVYVDDLGHETVVRRETPADFTVEFATSDGQYTLLSIPLTVPGLEGEIYLYSSKTRHGDGVWDIDMIDVDRAARKLPAVRLPQTAITLHGIATDESRFSRHDHSVNLVLRMDIRGASYSPILSRDRTRTRSDEWWEESVLSNQVCELLQKHLNTTPSAKGVDGWVYKQRLVSRFPIPEFWPKQAGMIRIFESGKAQVVSLQDVQTLSSISVLAHQQKSEVDVSNIGGTVILESDMQRLADIFLTPILADRRAINVRRLADSTLVDLVLDDLQGYPTHHHQLRPGVLPGNKNVMWFGSFGVLDTEKPLGEWLMKLERSPLNTTSSDEFWRHVFQAFSLTRYCAVDPIRPQDVNDLHQFMQSFRNIPSLPADLLPPDISLKTNMFQCVISRTPFRY